MRHFVLTFELKAIIVLTFEFKESIAAFCTYFWVERKYCGILVGLTVLRDMSTHWNLDDKSSASYFPFFLLTIPSFVPFVPCVFFSSLSPFSFSSLLSSFFYFTSYLPSWKASQMDLKWSPLPGGGIRNFIQHSRNLPALLNKIFNVFLIRLRCYQHFNKIIDQFLSQSNQYLVSEGITNIEVNLLMTSYKIKQYE